MKKNNKKYEAVIIATNKKLIGKMNKKYKEKMIIQKNKEKMNKEKMNKKNKEKRDSLKYANKQIKVLMREVNRLSKIIVKVTKHCA